MSHAIGANIGGIRTIEDVRLRCYCDADSGCWHLRSARGKAMPTDKTHKFWVHGVGVLSATRAVWQIKTGKPVPRGMVVSRTCASYDCVAHLRCWTKAQEGAHLRAAGKTASEKRVQANRAAGAKRSRLTPELRRWLVESTQCAGEVAHALDISHSHISYMRAKARSLMAGMASSVFALGDKAANKRIYRRAA